MTIKTIEPRSFWNRLGIFCGWGLVSGFSLLVTADVTSRLLVANQAMSFAVSKCFHYMRIQGAGTIYLLFPFALTGLVSAISAREGHMRRGWCLFFCNFALLAPIYFNSHIAAQNCLLKKQWTGGAGVNVMSVTAGRGP